MRWIKSRNHLNFFAIGVEKSKPHNRIYTGWCEDWLNKISGSQGIAGAADSIFVLERARVTNGGVLHRTGRDVEEMDFAMTLDGFGWVLQGDVEQFTMPEWKRQILDYLKEHDSVTPTALATALNMNINTAQQNLRRLVKDGELKKEGYGTYIRA